MRTLALAVALSPAIAAADISHSDLIAGEPVGDLVFARQLVPDTAAAATLAQSRIIYLNRTGVTVTTGANDARTNRSSLVGSPHSIPAWNTTAAKWTATVACLTDMFAPFAVTVTDRNPGNVPHIEAVFGGKPQDLGMPSNVGGVSPFTASCGVIENSIVFAFTDVLSSDPQSVCEVMAQEIAHSYGLDHELLASDPMTYLSYNGKRTFKDEVAPCGESQPRACGIGGTACRSGQNSFAILRERLGTPDAKPPTLTITSPDDNAMIEAGLVVTATAADDLGVRSATLLVDGEEVDSASGAGPFRLEMDDISSGVHDISVDVSDGVNITTKTIVVTVQRDDDGGMLDGLGVGCAATGGQGNLAFVLAGLLVILHRRR